MQKNLKKREHPLFYKRIFFSQSSELITSFISSFIKLKIYNIYLYIISKIYYLKDSKSLYYLFSYLINPFSLAGIV